MKKEHKDLLNLLTSYYCSHEEIEEFLVKKRHQYYNGKNQLIRKQWKEIIKVAYEHQKDLTNVLLKDELIKLYNIILSEHNKLQV